MVQLAFASTIVALVAALAVSAAPSAGTYVLTHLREDKNLTLESKGDYPLLFPQEFVDDPLSQEVCPGLKLGGRASEFNNTDVRIMLQWVLERSSGSDTFSFKSAKFGVYLGYESAKLDATVMTKNEPTVFSLVPGSDRKTYHIITAGKDSATGLVLDTPRFNRFGGPTQSLNLVPRNSNQGAWMLTRKGVPKPSKPQQAAGNSKCGMAAPAPAWRWSN
ncbi:hypothetical protein FRC12_015209 [Ceratobasidium sp. 428]|nr:hypothetical protein FRC12_015209 [Ceratobasidium sp. 428]